jgi:hypothetical protein
MFPLPDGARTCMKEYEQNSFRGGTSIRYKKFSQPFCHIRSRTEKVLLNQDAATKRARGGISAAAHPSKFNILFLFYIYAFAACGRRIPEKTKIIQG